MLTDEQIKKAAFKNAKDFSHCFPETSHTVAFVYGAKWANYQNSARIAELEAQNAELKDHVTKLVDASFKLIDQRNYLLQVYNRLSETFGVEPLDLKKDFPKK